MVLIVDRSVRDRPHGERSVELGAHAHVVDEAATQEKPGPVHSDRGRLGLQHLGDLEVRLHDVEGLSYGNYETEGTPLTILTTAWAAGSFAGQGFRKDPLDRRFREPVRGSTQAVARRPG